MMCDLESYSDENGMPSEECLKALQNEDIKECYLQDCPGADSQVVSLFICLFLVCSLAGLFVCLTGRFLFVGLFVCFSLLSACFLLGCLLKFVCLCVRLFVFACFFVR